MSTHTVCFRGELGTISIIFCFKEYQFQQHNEEIRKKYYMWIPLLSEVLLNRTPDIIKSGISALRLFKEVAERYALVK